MSDLTEHQKTLYNNLLHLTDTNEAFYFRDNIKDDVTYRIFTYRLASYSDFLLPGATECRGIMFELYNDKPIRLASLTMAKFWNWKENPFTMDLDFHNHKQIMYKMDGSLISSFQHKGKLCFKSKTALYSDHAVGATLYVIGFAPVIQAELDHIAVFEQELLILEKAGYTVNCEFTSPNYPFRIVVGYQETKLTILNVRNRTTGEYITLVEAQAILNNHYKNTAERLITQHWIETVDVADDAIDDFINSIDAQTGIEGYVIQLHDGMLVKIKTDWYRALHHVKDSINCMRRLFEAVLEEATDDLRAMLYDDPISLARINDMEVKVVHIYNSTVKNVETFYAENVNLDRKDFAIKAQTVLSHLEFGLVMNQYSGKQVDYKGVIKRNYKLFGIVDEEPEMTE